MLYTFSIKNVWRKETKQNKQNELVHQRSQKQFHSIHTHAHTMSEILLLSKLMSSLVSARTFWLSSWTEIKAHSLIKTAFLLPMQGHTQLHSQDI